MTGLVVITIFTVLIYVIGNTAEYFAHRDVPEYPAMTDLRISEFAPDLYGATVCKQDWDGRWGERNYERLQEKRRREEREFNEMVIQKRIEAWKNGTP